MKARIALLNTMGVLLLALMVGLYMGGRPLLMDKFVRAEMEHSQTGRLASELTFMADAPFTALARNAFLRLLLLVFGGALPALIALWVVENMAVLKPLNRLSERAHAIRRGETEKRIGWVRHSELGEVARGLDRQITSNYAERGARDFQPLNLNTLLSEILRSMRASLSGQIHFDVCLADDLPLVHGNPTQLGQVALNLLTNASDALGGRPGSIRMTTRTLTAGSAELDGFLGTAELKPGLYAMLEVADSGCGMSEQTMMRIFDPFFPTCADERGLGLSATLGILQAHGGGIRAQSRPEKGSTFHVIFPAVPPPDTVAESVANAVGDPEPAPPQTSPDPARKLALIADDDPHICRLLALMARSAGWEVVTANQGRAAVDLFHRHVNEIRLVFLDEEMPELNGHAVLRVIRGRCPHLHAVIISGHGVAACTQRFADLRPTAILAKPFRRDDLMVILNRAE